MSLSTIRQRLTRALAPALVALLLVTPLPTTPPLAAASGRGDTEGAMPSATAGNLLYLALGDSVAAGTGASTPAEGGYAALVGGRLGEVVGERVLRLNLAVPGETTTSFVSNGQLDWALLLLTAAKRSGVDVGPITVTIGANDLLRAGESAAERREALRLVAANLRYALAQLSSFATGPEGATTEPTLIVTGYYDLSGTDRDEPGTDGWWLTQLDATLAREARRAGARWVDVAPAFRGHERTLTRYPFDIHPSDAGHRAIATVVWRVLVGTLEEEDSDRTVSRRFGARVENAGA